MLSRVILNLHEWTRSICSPRSAVGALSLGGQWGDGQHCVCARYKTRVICVMWQTAACLCNSLTNPIARGWREILKKYILNLSLCCDGRDEYANRWEVWVFFILSQAILEMKVLCQGTWRAGHKTELFACVTSGQRQSQGCLCLIGEITYKIWD